MDFDPSSATSLLDLQPDIPRSRRRRPRPRWISILLLLPVFLIFNRTSPAATTMICKTHACQTCIDQYFLFPVVKVVERIAPPVAVSLTNQWPPRPAHTELAAAGATGILFFSHGSSPDGLTFLLLLPVFSLLRRRPTLNCEETGATDMAGPHGARGRVRRRNDEVEVRTEVEVDCGIGDTELGLEL